MPETTPPPEHADEHADDTEEATPAPAVTITGTLGKVEEFDRHREDWPQYVERLEHFFAANAITTAARKRSVLLCIVGASTYKVLRNLLSPVKPGDATYRVLVDKLTEHYSPRPSEMVERFKFHTRFRKPGESVNNYIAQLRSLSEHCNFGTTLDVMIRDRLVCGINDDIIQKRLLAEPNLTYTKAVQLSQSLETADKNVRLLRTSKKEPEHSSSASGGQEHVHRMAYTGDRNKGGTSDLTCFRCGNHGHIAPKCRVSKQVVCNQCGKTGHLQKACRGGKPKGPVPRKQRSTPGSRVYRVQDELVEDETIYQVRAKPKLNVPPLEIQIQMDDCLVKMEVDTGASMSLMSEKAFRELWPRRSLSTTEVRLCSYSKQPIHVVGKCYVNITYKGQTQGCLY